MENKYCVYIHVFPNKKVYIGITSIKTTSRWGLRGQKYTAVRMSNAIKKYGWENVEHYILESNITKEQAIELEIKLIKSHNSNQKEFGYNNTIGGEYGCLGYKHKERKLSEDHKRKIGIAIKGNVAWNKGIIGVYKSSKETVEKRKKTIKERYTDGNFKSIPIHYVLQMDLDNNIIAVWDNANSAIKFLGIKGVRSCCDFYAKTSNGFKFRYAEDFDKQYMRRSKLIT